MKLRQTFIRVALCGGAALGLVGLTAPGAASVAKTPPVKEKGTITCHASGTITFKPALALSKTAKTTMTVSGTLNSCKTSTGSKKITISSGKLTGKSSASMSCESLQSGLPKLTGMITWKAKRGSVASTSYSFSSGTPTFSRAPITFSYPKKGGSGVAKGSFATTKAKAALVLKQTESQLIGMCMGSGLKTLNFTKASTFTA